MVKLNQSAGEILRRCDGETTVKALVADLEQSFSTSGLLPEVEHFLDHALLQRWIVLDAEAQS
jgi:pyrroloquinoline quinone biosynthesis protein D